MIRKLNLGDLVKLEKYAKFPMPNINNSRYQIQWSLIDNDDLIGAVFGKKTCEISMILDSSFPWTTKTRAWLEAFDLLDQTGIVMDYDDVHAFVCGENAENHAKLMRKLGFVDATGIPLYYQLGSSKYLNRIRNDRRDRESSQQLIEKSA